MENKDQDKAAMTMKMVIVPDDDDDDDDEDNDDGGRTETDLQLPRRRGPVDVVLGTNDVVPVERVLQHVLQRRVQGRAFARAHLQELVNSKAVLGTDC